VTWAATVDVGHHWSLSVRLGRPGDVLIMGVRSVTRMSLFHKGVLAWWRDWAAAGGENLVVGFNFVAADRGQVFLWRICGIGCRRIIWCGS
jgi:hypothetical protein